MAKSLFKAVMEKKFEAFIGTKNSAKQVLS